MSIIAEALQDVGYKPTKPRTARQNMAFNREHIILAVIEDVLEPLIKKPRKIQYQRAGDCVLARYEGERAFVFGTTQEEAANRLQTWAGRP
jgi:hypothetical protein